MRGASFQGCVKAHTEFLKRFVAWNTFAEYEFGVLSGRVEEDFLTSFIVRACICSKVLPTSAYDCVFHAQISNSQFWHPKFLHACWFLMPGKDRRK